MTHYYLGVDVGTGSARAGLFDASGAMLASARRDITIWREAGSVVEQSSGDIWRAVCESVREAVATADVDPAAVAGIGYDATCSLVVLGAGGKPLAVGPSNDPQRGIIVWMDHRAVDQAERINATKAKVLDYVGGTISPEMETPKLLWLKKKQAGNLCRRLAVFRPHLFPHLEILRLAIALGLHRHLQMDLSQP